MIKEVQVARAWASAGRLFSGWALPPAKAEGSGGVGADVLSPPQRPLLVAEHRCDSADQRLRDRLLDARRRGSRWHRKKRKRAPSEKRPTSEALHRSYRQPAPLPPPNSPCCNVLGLPVPLQGAAYINPPWAPLPPSSRACLRRPRCDAADAAATPTAPDAALHPKATPPPRPTPSPSPPPPPPPPPRNACTTLQVYDPNVDRGPRPGEGKSPFLDLVYKTVRMELKRLSSINLSDAREETQTGKAALKRETTFLLSQMKSRKMPSPQLSRSDLIPLMNPEKKSVKDQGSGSFDELNSVADDLPIMKSEEEEPVLPPLVIKKDEVLNNTLKASSTLSLGSIGEKPKSYPRLLQTTYQKGGEWKNRSEKAKLRKMEEIGTKQLIEELTDGGISFSSSFHLGKINERHKSPVKHATDVKGNLINVCSISSSCATRKSRNTVNSVAADEYNNVRRNHVIHEGTQKCSNFSGNEDKSEPQNAMPEKMAGQDELASFCTTLASVSESSKGKRLPLPPVRSNIDKIKTSFNIQNEVNRSMILSKEIDDYLSLASKNKSCTRSMAPSLTKYCRQKPCGDGRYIEKITLNMPKPTDSVRVPRKQGEVFSFVKHVVKLKRSQFSS